MTNLSSMKKFTADVTHPEDVLKQAHRAEIEALRKEYDGLVNDYHAEIDAHNETKMLLQQANELVDQFAVLAGVAKFENEDLRRQLAKAQKIITTYSVDMCELHTLTDEVFQLLYGADVGEPFPIDMVPDSVRTALNKQLEKFGKINEAMPD